MPHAHAILLIAGLFGSSAASIISGMPSSAAGRVFVGRATELALLTEELAAAGAGEARLVLLGGDAGVGKSRVAAEFAAQARHAGSRVLVGSCLPLAEVALPYAPLVEAFRRFLDEDPAAANAVLAPARDELDVLVPELASGNRERGDPPTSLGQSRLFEAILGVLDRLGTDAPIVLILEDLHWLDGATRDLLTFLSRNLAARRVLLLGTYRSDGLPPGEPLPGYVRELARQPHVRQLELHPLGRREIEQLMAALLGRRPGVELVDRVWERGEGNPFYTQELLAEHGGGSDALPRTLAELLGARLAPLSRSARAVLGLLAVAGREASEALLEAAELLAADALVQGIRETRQRGILVLDGTRYAFAHELLREAVLADLEPLERRDLHLRLARLLEAHLDLADPTWASAAAELAVHWAGAGRPQEAFRASIEAGLAAEAVYAMEEAHRDYERALDLWDHVPSDERRAPLERGALLEHAADAANLAGNLTRALELARLALAEADPQADPRRVGLLHARLGYLRWAAGDGEAALGEHREAVRLVPEKPPTVQRARVVGALAGALMGLGRYRESSTAAREALRCARAASSPEEESRARNFLGCDLVALGRGEAGIAELRTSLELAMGSRSADVAIVAHHNLAYLLVQLDRYAEAVDAASEGRTYAAEHHLDHRFGASLLAVRADALFREGRWREAETTTTEALELDRSDDGPLYVSAVQARLLAAQGRLDDPAAAELAARLRAADGDPDLVAFVRLAEAELAAANGRLAEAIDAVDAGLTALAASDDPSLRAPLCALGLRLAADEALRASDLREASDLERTRERSARYLEALDTAPRRPMTPSGAAWRGTSVAEAARGEGRDTTLAWLEVAGAWDAVPAPYPAAYARLRAAEAALRSGDRETASTALRTAAAASARLGAAPLAGEIASLARRGRIALEEGAVPSGTAPATPETPGLGAAKRLTLSPRELEVLALVAAGRTNGQIGAELFISTKTAGVHVTHILDKLGVANRVEAAMVAVRLGLAGPGPDADPPGPMV